MSTANAEAKNFPTPNILCLDIDCLEELFEWLLLRDLRALRASCKRMKQAVDYHIKTAYPRGIGRLKIRQNNIPDLQRFDASYYMLFKHIELPFTPINIEGIENILNNSETITAHHSCVDTLQHCKNLKHLIIDLSYGMNYIDRTYPSLEHFTLLKDNMSAINILRIPRFRMFLERNPNIQRFSTYAKFIVENQNWMIRSNVKLDQLDVEIDCTHRVELVAIYPLLTALHERGFYRKLHLTVRCIEPRNALNDLLSLPAIEELHLDQDSVKGVGWQTMGQLKELTIEFTYERQFPIDLNLDRIYLGIAAFNYFIPFFHRCARLKKVKINYPRNDVYCSDNVIDLSALNKERRKCANASKVTIYVKEIIYLATKEALMRTDFDLIELKREQTEAK